MSLEDSQDRQATIATAAAVSPATAPISARPLVVSLAWDIVLTTTIPLGCYLFWKRFVSPSELAALLFATSFPALKGAYDLLRRREINPVAVLVLLGIVSSILALSVGGDPRLLLIRESFFTGAFGLACLVSLVFPRPMMFYFGRYFMAGADPAKRAHFDAGWGNSDVRRGHRLVTVVWGVVYTAEFVLRIILAYSLPAAVVLVISPTITGLATILTILWTFRYAFRPRGKVAT